MTSFIILRGINPQTGTITQFTIKLNKRWLIHWTLAVSELASCLLLGEALEMAHYAEAPQESGFPTLTLLQHSTLYCAHSFLSWINLPFIQNWPIIRGNQLLSCLLVWLSPHLSVYSCLPHSCLHLCLNEVILPMTAFILRRLKLWGCPDHANVVKVK